jgi:hypothetical protein
VADNGAVAATAETNIVVPQCAFDALEEWRAGQGLRRDPAVRQLLNQYILSQQRLAREQRLTHISTIIWHPDMPVGRRQQAPYAVRLRMRLMAGVAGAAGALALRLPGQTDGVGGYHDYRPRLLADAFLTSLAGVTEFSDDVLDDLPPLLTYRQAIGLFRLTIAASSTNAERRIYRRADRDLDQVHSSARGASLLDPGTEHAIAIATVLRHEDVAWHGPWRRAVTRHLARKWLTGAEAGPMLADIDAQDAVAFGSQIRLLEQDNDHLRDELDGLRRWYGDSEGRGGTAIWRAERRLETHRMLRWLAESASIGAERSFEASEPGWTLTLPDSWRAATVRHGDADRMRPHAELARVGRVIHAQSGGTHVFWPYQLSAGSRSRLEPIPAISTVLALRSNRDPAEVIELLLAPEWCPGVDINAIEMSAFVAHDLGFINRRERDQLVEQARVQTQDRMQVFRDAVPNGHRDLQRRLTEAMSCPAEFTQITGSTVFQRAVRSLGTQRFVETRARVPWPHPIISLASEINRGADGTGTPLVERVPTTPL